MTEGKQTEAEAFIRALAKRHNVEYVQTPNDVLANNITRLSGDDVILDEVELLLVALERAGHIDRREGVQLQAQYLHEKKKS